MTSRPSIPSLDDVQRLLDASRPHEASRLLAALLEVHPDSAALHRMQAMVLQRDARPADAVGAMRRAVAIDPANAVLRLELGQVLAAAGDVDAAIESFLAATSLDPGLARAWHLLGALFYAARRDHEARGALRRAFALSPDDPAVVRGLAEAEYATENHDGAIELFQRLAGDGSPRDPGVFLRLAQCHRRSGDPLRALAIVEDGIALFPDDASLWLERGWAQEALGDAGQALAAHRRALALRPGWADPLAAAMLLDGSGELVAKAQAQLTSAGLPRAEQAFLHHALGKRADLAGDHGKAAGHWQAANRLRREVDGAFPREALAAQVDAAIAHLTAERIAERGGHGCADERPLFVVGMPRSGTTLVEQILSAHPSVHGCGELTGIVGIAQDMPEETGLRWPHDVARMDGAWLRERASRYLLAAGRRAAGPCLRLVDKQPYNFLNLGLIALLFPLARVVWCRRDPFDLALSIYSESFSPSATYATDLSDIAFVIGQQERLMRHWQAVLPLPVLELPYEDLVASPEPHMRRLVEFAGLPWSPQCLDFHQSKRPVQTPSRWQVRQPIHPRSVGRWRHYARWFSTTDPSP